MIRLNNKVFSDLAVWMIGLGLTMGAVFPFFVFLMGVPSRIVLTPWFFVTCMGAGFVVGAGNIGLARNVVGKRLRLLAESMQAVEGNLNHMATGNGMEGCASEDCSIAIDSNDEIGDSVKAFNKLVATLAEARQSERAVRDFSQMLASWLELETLAERALQQIMTHTQSSAGALLVENRGRAKDGGHPMACGAPPT